MKFKTITIVISALLFSVINSNAQKPEKDVSAVLDLPSKFIEVKSTKLHYVEQGSGDPILFLHGIPTNLYLWRNVIPEVAGSGRAIALDLAGFGKSDVPATGGFNANNQYTFLEGFIEKMGLKNITLVVNDLGSVYGLKYAADHPENIKGIVVTEGVMMPAYEWRQQLTIMQKMMFGMFRNDRFARRMIVKKPKIQNMIVPMMTKRKLSGEEKNAYREPYKTDTAKRRLMFEGPGPVNFPKKRNLKPGNATNEFIMMMNSNAEKLKGTRIPILILYAKPGFILRKKALKYAKENYPNLTTEYVGKGKHFLPEDHPKAIGQFIKNWMTTLK
jgi:haloalkane dehalogenase